MEPEMNTITPESVNDAIAGDATRATDLFGGMQTPGQLTLTPFAVALSVATTCAMISELIVWYIIYRHEDYKKLSKDFEEAQTKLDIMKEKLMFTAGTQTANQQKA